MTRIEGVKRKWVEDKSIVKVSTLRGRIREIN